MHRLDGIHDQVQDHLLQLNLVAVHGRNFVVKLRLKLHAVLLQIDPHNRQNCIMSSLMSTGVRSLRILSEHRANT